METIEKVHDRRGRPDSLKIEQVIHLSFLRGEGTNYDNIRMVE